MYCQRQNCSPWSVVSGDISFMSIFVGVCWWGGVKWECGHRRCEFSLSIAISSIWSSSLALHIEIYAALHSFPATAWLLFMFQKVVWLVTSSMQYYWFFGPKYFCPVCILLLLFLVLTWLILRRSHHRLKILVRVYLKTYFSCVLANSVSVIVTHQSILTVIHPYQSLLDLVFI